ncbi:CLUMA_CG005777, isoform A [Clunio marinus]|uniref:CLUMA_CG005777, isoform A n=1 Tax=Clunio marinus TaxID=568069 RepID=A0A1J1HVR7_9DIPT|nr:CLUMA_CG005777, isoform A [Clunio marinus]
MIARQRCFQHFTRGKTMNILSFPRLIMVFILESNALFSSIDFTLRKLRIAQKFQVVKIKTKNLEHNFEASGDVMLFNYLIRSKN